MDLVDPILTIAEKIYALFSEMKANKSRRKRLAKRMHTLMDLVSAVKKQDLRRGSTIVQKILSELMETLKSAHGMLKKYASYNYVNQLLKANILAEEIGSLNERLTEAAQHLGLALQIEQRDKMKIFDEDTRRKEDEEDRKSDYKELQKLLQALADEKETTKLNMDAVNATVEQTQKDIQDIKGILESLRKPSIHLEDIKEISYDKLIYDIPINLIMKTGNFEMYKGEYNKFTVAIKKYTASTSAKEVRKIFKKEVETMKRFESPHILRMFGICIQNENGPNPTYLIVTEFCDMGSLRQVLDGPNELPWDRKVCMCLDAVQGLYRLHLSEDRCKVHGCISSSKFLVSSGYRVKLGGFELAMTETSLRNNKKREQSNAAYLSPQQLENLNHTYDKACEIYSFGIVLWEIATRQIPFKGLRSDDIHEKVCIKRETEALPPDCPDKLKVLIDACRSYDDFKRPSAGVLVDKFRELVHQNEN